MNSPHQPVPGYDASATTRVAVLVTVGLIAFALTVLAGGGGLAPVVGWDAGALIYLVWMWVSIWWLDAEQTAQRAVRDDPAKLVADGLLVSASVVSLVAIGALLIKAGHSHGTSKNVLVGVGILSVVIGWSMVHTIFTLRYTRLYYEQHPGGVDFNEPDRPRYTDFAYLAFTIGMTFQVSDTDIQNKDIRATALRHGLLSYVFGAVIIATTINLIAGLTH